MYQADVHPKKAIEDDIDPTLEVETEDKQGTETEVEIDIQVEIATEITDSSQEDQPTTDHNQGHPIDQTEDTIRKEETIDQETDSDQSQEKDTDQVREHDTRHETEGIETLGLPPETSPKLQSETETHQQIIDTRDLLQEVAETET